MRVEGRHKWSGIMTIDLVMVGHHPASSGLGLGRVVVPRRRVAARQQGVPPFGRAVVDP